MGEPVSLLQVVAGGRRQAGRPSLGRAGGVQRRSGAG